MPERTVAHVMVTYHKDTGTKDPLTDRTIFEVKHVLQGETVDTDDMLPHEFKRLEMLGAFKPETDESVPEKSFAEMDVTELEEWIRETGPNVQDTLNATGGDADLAHRILEAETAATGGDPRDGVVKGIHKILDNATK